MSKLSKRDIEQIEADCLKELHKVSSTVARDVDDLIADSADAETDFLDAALIVVEFGLDELSHKHDCDAFNDNGLYLDAIDAGVQHGVAIVALSSRDISEDMKRKDLEACEAMADTLDDIKGGSSRRSNSRRSNSRDRDRDDRDDRGSSRRNGRTSRRDRDDRDRGERRSSSRSSRRDRDDDEDRNDRRTSRAGSRNSRARGERKTPSTYINRKEISRAQEEAERDEAREKRSSRRSPAEEPKPIQAKLTLAIESAIVAMRTVESSHVYDGTKFVLVHRMINDTEAEEVLVGVDEMETYEEHELHTSPFGSDETHTNRFIKPVDFKGVPDLASRDASKLHVNKEPISIYSDTTVPNISGHLSTILKTVPTVTTILQYSTLALPASMSEYAIAAQAFDTFSAWYDYMDELNALIETTQDIDRCILAAFLTELDNRFTLIFNSCLSVAVSPHTKVASFYRNYEDAMSFLKEPAQRMELEMYRSLEVPHLRACFEVLTSKELEELDTKVAAQLPSDPLASYLVIRSTTIYLKVLGEMMTNTLRFPHDGEFAAVAYGTTPDFYELCTNALRYVRTLGSTLPNVIASDSFGSNVLIVSSGAPGSAIRAKQI